MKTTFITTVFNEEEALDDFLNSILLQTKLPDEIIIVDGFSIDDTSAILSKFKKKNSNLNIKLLKKRGNIATGRNFAIQNSKNEIILCSDAGCKLNKNWVKRMTEGFDKDIDVVAGFYKPLSDNIFQKSLSTYTSVMPDKIDKENFLPSSRSIAFKKEAWKKVEGYPQWLDTCEDLYFVRELKRKGFKFKFIEDAVVFWPQRNNVNEAFWQFFHYAKGDGKARFVRRSTPFLFGRYALGIGIIFIILSTSSSTLLFFLIFSLFMYVIWAIRKNYKYVNDHRAYFYLPLLQFMSDFAVIFGMGLGFLQSLAIKRK